MAYISLKLIRYSRAYDLYQNIRERLLLLTEKLQNQAFLVVKIKLHFESLTIGIMTWLSVTKYMIRLSGYVPFVVVTIPSTPPPVMTFRVLTKVTRQVPLAEKELNTPSDHMCFWWVRIAHILLFSIWFSWILIYILFWSLYCLSCHLLFWLPLWYLYTFLLDWCMEKQI